MELNTKLDMDLSLTLTLGLAPALGFDVGLGFDIDTSIGLNSTRSRSNWDRSKPAPILMPTSTSIKLSIPRRIYCIRALIHSDGS